MSGFYTVYSVARSLRGSVVTHLLPVGKTVAACGKSRREWNRGVWRYMPKGTPVTCAKCAKFVPPPDKCLNEFVKGGSQ